MSGAGLYVCEVEGTEHPHGRELLIYAEAGGAWCCGHSMTKGRGLTAQEKRELAADERRSRSEARTAPREDGGEEVARGTRTPEPDAEAAKRAIELLQGGGKRSAVAAETGLTDYQVWRVQRDNGLLKVRG